MSDLHHDILVETVKITSQPLISRTEVKVASYNKFNMYFSFNFSLNVLLLPVTQIPSGRDIETKQEGQKF